MEEYVEDELVDGKDDEKRIQRADFRAGEKLKSVKGAKNKKGSGPQSSKKPQHTSTQARKGPSSDGTMAQYYLQSIRCLNPLVASKQAEACSSLALVLCGKHGHLRKACPLLLGTADK